MTQEPYNRQEGSNFRVFRRMFPFYLAFVGLVTLGYGLLNVRIGANWPIGDWLINYHGGFVRRGLAGEICLDLAHILHLSPLYIVLLVQIFFYSVIFYVVWRLAAAIRWSLWLVLILVSPATLAFHVLDPTAGFRKEIILFAGLGLLLLWLLKGRPHIVSVAAYLTALCVGCVLSHEALMIFFPYLLGALWLGFGSVRRVVAVALFPLLGTFVAAFFVVHHPGSRETAEAICSSVGAPVTTPLSGICGGAIAGLTLNSDTAKVLVLTDARDFHYLTLYSVAGLLAFLPVVLAYVVLWRRAGLRSNLIVIAAVASGSMAASSVLFYYATDWGRWIYIHLFCIFMLLLAVEHWRQRNLYRDDEGLTQPVRSVSPSIVVFVLVYMLCWDLPHVGRYGGRFGYFGLAQYAVNYRAMHPQIQR